MIIEIKMYKWQANLQVQWATQSHQCQHLDSQDESWEEIFDELISNYI